ncbi:MAG: GNAT family N-acetyltransferase [Dyella sp.]
MPSPPQLRLVPLDARLRPALLQLRVWPAQLRYVGAISDLLADAESSPDCAPMVIALDERPIGYYRIDPNPRAVVGRELELPALGLRSFFIDADQQGRGYGRQALRLLLETLRWQQPQAQLLALTVSRRNHDAWSLYRRSGFTDDGQLYHDPGTGPLHLMRYRLHS